MFKHYLYIPITRR